jgi:uncharacterized membrane protein
MSEFSKDDGKLAGIVSYFTIVGWLIAYFAFYQNNKTYLSSYQLRQTLLFHIISTIVYYAVGALLITPDASFGITIFWLIRVALFVIWIIGLLGALQGENKPMPLIGERAQSMFSGI